MSKRSKRKGGVLAVTDRQAGGSERNNYMKKLLMMQQAGLIGKPGSLEEITILHDSTCTVFDGGFCGCNPDISVKPIVG